MKQPEIPRLSEAKARKTKLPGGDDGPNYLHGGYPLKPKIVNPIIQTLLSKPLQEPQPYLLLFRYFETLRKAGMNMLRTSRVTTMVSSHVAKKETHLHE